MKSIIQNTKECYICRIEATIRGYTGELSDQGLHDHHIFYGTANKPISERLGLKVFLCLGHHGDHKRGVHHNRKLNLMLREMAQRKFEENHTHEEFINEFGENWL